MSHKEHADKERGHYISGFHVTPAGTTSATLEPWPWTARQKRRAASNRKTRKQARRVSRNLR